MFSRLSVRSILTAALAAALLVPAGQADDWGLQARTTVDPAIAAAIHDRGSLTPAPVALDSSIQAALLERASSITRPDDRPGSRGVGSLPQSTGTAAEDGFEWSTSVGAGAIVAALLLTCGTLLAVRLGRARVTSA